MKLTSKYIKRYTPKSLLGRVLLILIVPTILAQALSIYMFYERHMGHVSRQLALSMAAEVATIADYIELADNPEDEQKYLAKAYRLFAFSPQLMSVEQAQKHTAPLKRIKLQPYTGQLEGKLGNRKFEVFTDDEKVVTTLVYLANNVLVVDVQYKRVVNSTSYIFLLWMVGITTILLIIAMIFLKNQIRPVIRLSRLADNFGRGNDISYIYKPEGAYEIRQAYKAFMNMHERISRFIKQRTEMLAGISHDLRTPLTRMKLELAIQKEKNEFTTEMEKDINELEKMLNSYIEFVRGDEGELTSQHDIGQLINEVVARYDNVTVEAEKLQMFVRQNSIKRVIRNLVDNALKYATKLVIKAYRSGEFAVLEFHDNGPGIPADKREEVFKPFYRLEESRNSETGGIGLGLSIVRDIVNAHGGTITLEDSDMGGLKAVVKLPI